MKKTASRKISFVEPSLPDVLQALADPVRLEIVRKVARRGAVRCGEFGIDAPKSTLSHHFGVLRSAGVLGTRDAGTSTFNYLRTEEMERRFPGLLESVIKNLA